MPNGLVVNLAIAGLVAALSLLLGRAGGGLRWRWLVASLVLLLVHDALLTNFYRALPSILPGEMNWQGKLLALAATLAVAALPAFGWRRSGLTLAQAPGSLRSALPVAAVYALVFGGLSIVMGGEGTAEEVAFQLTLPGLEEEPFYRGVLLLALDRALPGRWRFAGVDWGWGAVLTSLAFGLDHAMSFGAGGFGLDPLYLALTALPSLIAVWIRYRTGSLLIPVLLHNWGNSAGHLV